MQDFVRSLGLRFPSSHLSAEQVAAWAEELESRVDPSGLKRLLNEMATRSDRMPPISSVVSAATDLGLLLADSRPKGDPVYAKGEAQGSCPKCGRVYRWTEETWAYPGGRTQRTVPGNQRDYAEYRVVRRMGECRECAMQVQAAQADYEPGQEG
jgi:hypothetical protein